MRRGCAAAALALAALGWVALGWAAQAGEARVVDMRIAPQGSTFRIDVTAAHADEGWDHYADAWRVLGPDGAVLGVREVLHPHVDEQPFTRLLSGVTIPPGVAQVRAQVRDSVHGWGPVGAPAPVPGR